MTQLTIPTPDTNPDPGVVLDVPLNRLKPSPRNARKTPHTPANIEALAASIAAKGMIQPPVVEPERDAAGEGTGFYFVTVGEGRRQALALRAKRKEIGKAALVRCIVDVTHDAFEISLDENVTRFPMHPADQFEAFQTLAQERGFGPEEIAARFGVTATVVRQRLRLATVSPKLIDLYRAGEMSLDQLMAFTITSDIDRQEAAWDSLSWNKEPALIRRVLTQDRVSARDRRAVLVGAEAYMAAGGVIERDLFSEDHGGYFADPLLLERLALERLVALTEEVRGQGWKWASASLDMPPVQGLRRVYPQRLPLTDEVEAHRQALQADYDALVSAHEEDEDLDPTVSEELDRLADELDGLDAHQIAYDAEDIARAGAFVLLGQDGAPRIECGFVRREDEDSTAHEDDAEDGSLPLRSWANDDESEEGEGEPRALAERLVADLTAQRTAALQATLGDRPDIALIAIAHALVLQAFGLDRRAQSCLQLRLTLTALPAWSTETDAGKAIEARHAGWATELPTTSSALWSYLSALSQDRLLALLAHCVSLAVNAIQIGAHRAPSVVQADQLALALGLDMADYWEPTVETYLGRVTKAHILAAVAEGAGQEQVRRIEGLKKEPMAESAEAILKGQRWLPSLLRMPDQVIEASDD